MSKKNDLKVNQKSAKVIQLGFNISLSGDPDADIEFALDDNGQGTGQSVQYEIENQHSEMQDRVTCMQEKDFESNKHSDNEVKSVESFGSNPKSNAVYVDVQSESSSNESASNKSQKSISKDVNLVSEIKNAMENFEKFSDRIKEIPRFKNYPIATSTPFSSKQNSKSESSLMYLERRPRRYAHLYDFNMRKERVKETMKPLPSDLFLRPLPGESLYRGSIVKRCDYEPFRIYGSVDSLTKSMDYNNSALLKSSHDDEKNYLEITQSEGPHGILKKSDSESGEKSISSTDTNKDIKIYQNGGILIMQNFREDFDEKIFLNKKKEREISELSAKLIENYNKLKEEISGDFQIAKEKNLIGVSPEEIKSSGKMVQFDIRERDNEKTKFSISQGSASKKDLLVDEDWVKNKENLPGSLQSCQDFPSMSTQENDSILSNPPENSPGTSGKKLEWDSGADVGYLNLDLTKENLSTIERIVLKGLSGDGLDDKSVVFEKKSGVGSSPFVLERRPSNFLIEEIAEEAEKNKSEPEGNEGSDSQEKKTAEKHARSHRERREIKKVDRRENDKKDEIDGIQVDASKDRKSSSSLQFDDKKSKGGFFQSVQVSTKSKMADSVDKSVNVNTLFEEEENRFRSPLESYVRNEPRRQCEFPTPKIKSSKHLSPTKGKKFKKKMANQRNNVTASLKEKIESIIDMARHSNLRLLEPEKMDLSKTRRDENVECEPEPQKIEKTRGDEKFDRNENGKSAMESELAKRESSSVGKNKGEIKTKRQSSINRNTELENGGERKKMVETLFVDRIVQTSNEFEVESIGIQAFSSQESSRCNFSSSRHEGAEVVKCAKGKCANFCSKNIQAFGLNSSLPMQLSHPKEAKFEEVHNTKGTQFYGGPINSLPNYHSQLVAKPVECCGRMLKVLKAKTNISTEVIQSSEENKKNIMANNKNSRKSEPKDELDNGRNTPGENKENLLTEKSAVLTTSCGRPPSETAVDSEDSMKNVDGESKKKSKKDFRSGSTCSDNPTCKLLTSKVLKEHGDVIDRNLIKEKYFRSQLMEIEKREMISKSTSMENPFGMEESAFERWAGGGGGGTGDYPVRAKKSATVACQYSSCSKEEVSDDGSKVADKSNKNCRRKEGSDQDSSQNFAEEEEYLETSKDTNLDTFPSSTQTAHSWIPGMRGSCRRGRSAVGRARSFEYLPGHIYESSGNLREKLPSENDHDVITGSSSGSSKSKKGSIEDEDEDGGGEGGRSSEGRKTLVLENSNEVSGDSSGLKNLNENLTQLNIVVRKLKEKDVQIQDVTRSLLINFWKQNGSGDNFDDLAVGDKSKTEITEKKNGADDEKVMEKRRNPEVAREGDFLPAERETDVSIACQTEEKSPGSSLVKYKEERKSLENRIAADKENQIKWIEKEIHHLNVLRGLLERENSSGGNQRRKVSNWTISSENLTGKAVDGKNSKLGEIRSNSVTPVYGCTISLTDPQGLQDNRPVSASEMTKSRETNCRSEPEMNPTASECTKYGMAVSVNGNLRKVILLPVGVQVSLNNSNPVEENSGENVSCRETVVRCCASSMPETQALGGSLRDTPEECHCDAETQYPSAKRRTTENYLSASVQTDPGERCISCRQGNCVCLNFSQSEKSYGATSRSQRENLKTSAKKDDSELAMDNEEPHAGGNKISDSSPDGDRNVNFSSRMSQRLSEKPNGESTAGSTKEKHSPFICKCENCPNRTSGRNRCRSSILVNCKKSSSSPVRNPAYCRCSKVQVRPSSACACHVIKIHGPICLTSDRSGSCSCKKSSGLKKMENQCCQTETVAEMWDSAERKNPCDSRQAAWMNVGTAERRGSIKKEGDDVFADCKSTFPPRVCRCQKKEKPKVVDDHPRHYFLKIEETEIDGSNESLERRSSLEVITVTVPVKKSGKGKIYGNNFGLSKLRQEQNKTGPFKDRQASSNECHCCEDCLGRKCMKRISRICEMKEQYGKDNEDDDEDDYGREVGKKKEANGRRIRQKRTERDSYEGFEKAREDENEYENSSYDTTRPSSTSQEDGYGERGMMDSMKSKVNLRRNEEESRRRESPCDCNRKEYGSQNCRCFEGAFKRQERNEGRRDRFQPTGKEDFEVGLGSRSMRQKKSVPEGDRYESDYYNYNKKEYMTKSELRKEEEKKQKKKKKRSQHVSLQESLASNRPDFYDSAERRRRIISEKARERVNNHQNRMDCLINLLHQCEKTDQSKESKRIFTTPQMREQTMKRYRTLPEVTEKAADQRKKEEYRTNKLMGDIFSKKLQRETLKGHTNLSNSVSVLSTV